jgi:hypothetical protein
MGSIGGIIESHDSTLAKARGILESLDSALPEVLTGVERRQV